MTEKIKWLKSNEWEWAADYLRARAEKTFATFRLRPPNRDYSSVVTVIKALNETNEGKLLVKKLQNALRQRRYRSPHNGRQSLTLTLPIDTINEIEHIAKTNKMSVAETIITSITKLHKLEKFHDKKIKEIKILHTQKMENQKSTTLVHQEKLNKAILLIEESLKNALIAELINSKIPDLAGEELEKAEVEVAERLKKKMAHAIRMIDLAAKVRLIEPDQN